MSNCPKASLLALVVVFSVVLSGVKFNSEPTIVFGQTKAISDIKKVHVGDIDIAYKCRSLSSLIKNTFLS